MYGATGPQPEYIRLTVSDGPQPVMFGYTASATGVTDDARIPLQNHGFEISGFPLGPKPASGPHIKSGNESITHYSPHKAARRLGVARSS